MYEKTIREQLFQAHIAFTEKNSSSSPSQKIFCITRPGYSLSITSHLYLPPAIQIKPYKGPTIEFDLEKGLANFVGAMDALVQIARLTPRVNWSRRQLALISGSYPGSPVLVYDPHPAHFKIVPRPSSFNRLHKYAAVKTYRIDDDPRMIARQLQSLRQQCQPPKDWKRIVEDWNQKYSNRFGHELSLSASYIYTWTDVRFLLDGKDLCLDVCGLVPMAAFDDVIRLMESIRDVMQQSAGAPPNAHQTKTHEQPARRNPQTFGIEALN